MKIPLKEIETNISGFKVCSQCWSINLKDSKFCKNCGSSEFENSDEVISAMVSQLYSLGINSVTIEDNNEKKFDIEDNDEKIEKITQELIELDKRKEKLIEELEKIKAKKFGWKYKIVLPYECRATAYGDYVAYFKTKEEADEVMEKIKKGEALFSDADWIVESENIEDTFNDVYMYNDVELKEIN
jgi:hypothetical protein